MSRVPQARRVCLSLGFLFPVAQSLLLALSFEGLTLSLEGTVLLGFSCLGEPPHPAFTPLRPEHLGDPVAALFFSYIPFNFQPLTFDFFFSCLLIAEI